MQLRRIAVITLVFVLAVAPQVFAWGGGGRGAGGVGSGTGQAFSGRGGTGGASGMGGEDGSWNHYGYGGRVQTPEPFAGLVIGLGLLGARYLRRR